jgi:hypothetical protein
LKKPAENNVDHLLAEISIRKAPQASECHEVIERKKRKKSDVAMMKTGKISCSCLYLPTNWNYPVAGRCNERIGKRDE